MTDIILLTETASPITVFIGQHGIQLVLGVLLIYVAIKLLVFKDVDSIRPKEWGKLKEENVEPYAKEAGILLLVFAACAVFMEVISQYDENMGFLFIIISAALIFFRFKMLEDRYGNKNHGNKV